MKAVKNTMSLLLAAMLAWGAALPIRAAEDTPVPPTEEEIPAEPAAEEEVPGESAEEPYLVLDEAEVRAMVEEYMESHGVQSDRFSMAYCYTGTGETWSMNGDRFLIGASLYKLSLIMGLAEKVSAGQLQQTDQIYGMDISFIERRALTFSDNDVAERMIGYFGTFRDYRLMQARIAGVSEADLPEDFFSANVFSADFMMGVLKELYAHPEKYPNVMECLYEANPGEYFRRSLDGRFAVAQKYGGGDGYLHTAGIIDTPVPCLLVVMTHRVSNAQQVIADIGAMMADYSVTLDERTRAHFDELERQAEEARRAEEEARRAEEEAQRRAEEEERARQEAQRRAEEEAEAARIAAEEEAEKARLAAEAAREAFPLGIVITVVAGLTAVVGVFGLIRAHNKKKEYR